MKLEELQRIQSALEESKGDYAMAAVWLGVTTRKLHEIVKKNKELRFRWSLERKSANNPAPEVESLDTLSKPAELQSIDQSLVIPMDTKRLVDQMNREDRSVRDGLMRINLTPAEAEIAAELADFHQQHFVKSIHIMGAGVTRMSLKVQTQLALLEARIKDVQAQIEGLKGGDRSSMVMEERMLYECYRDLLDQLRRMFEIANRSAVMQADVMMRMRGQRPNDSKPGFTDG